MKKFKYGDGTMPEGEYYEVAQADSRISDLERQLTFSNDAAAKGESARLTAAGMEARIDELEKALNSCAVLLVKQRDAATQWTTSTNEALAEAAKALSLMESATK